ncbi:hypothetical protein C0992_005923 [Termitomyces sp. T32_za158]|nr:hypothetical protein C0992_005923 [Termitomyces sp. T32_za158]
MSTTSPSSASITLLQQEYAQLQKVQTEILHVLETLKKKDSSFLEGKYEDTERKMTNIVQELKERGGTLVPVAAPDLEVQIIVIVTSTVVKDLSRQISITLKQNSSVRDLYDHLRTKLLASYSSIDIYDVQTASLADEDQLVSGTIYRVHLHPTPPATPSPANSQSAVPNIYRSRSIKEILTALMQDNLVRVRAPPACGKSTVAEQIKERYTVYFDTVHPIINLAPYMPSRAQKEIFRDHPILLNLLELRQKKATTLLIIDEAQILNCINPTHPFWRHLKIIIDSQVKNLRILMFGVYGEGPSPIRSINPVLSSPISLPTVDFPVLHLDKNEYDTMVNRYNSYSNGIKLTKRCCEYLWTFLGGHIGLVKYLLEFLDRSHASHQLRTEQAQMTQEDDTKILEFIFKIGFRQLDTLRSIPTVNFLQARKVPHVIEVLHKIIMNGGKLPKDLLTEQHTAAIAFLLDTYCITSDTVHWCIASPYIQFAILRTWRNPVLSLPSFDSFLQQCITSIDYEELGKCESSSASGQVYEDPIKCALYAKMPSFLPIGARVDPEVGRFYGSTGRVDLWISDAKWAIEILRNHNAIEEHADRFQTTYSMLPINEYIVLNFVQEKDALLQDLNIPRNETSIKRVWHVHWSPMANHIVLRGRIAGIERLPVHQNPPSIAVTGPFDTIIRRTRRLFSRIRHP